MPPKKLVVAPLTVEGLMAVDPRLLVFQHESYTLLAQIAERAQEHRDDFRICDDVNEALKFADVIVLCSAIDYRIDHGIWLDWLCRNLKRRAQRKDLGFLLVTFSADADDYVQDDALGDSRLVEDLCVLNPTCDDVWKIVTADRETPASAP